MTMNGDETRHGAAIQIMKGSALSNLIEVTVLVPERDLASFYRMHSRFLRKHGGRGGHREEFRGFEGRRFGGEFPGGRRGFPGEGRPDFDGGPRGEGRRGFGDGPFGGRGHGRGHGPDRDEWFGDRGFGRGMRHGRGPGAVSAEERSAIWATGTEDERLADARFYYEMLRDNARRFLDLLLDSEGPIPANDVVEKLGLDSVRVLSGSMSSFGYAARRTDRALPFGWDVRPDGTTVYSITDDVAELFRTARGGEATAEPTETETAS